MNDGYLELDVDTFFRDRALPGLGDLDGHLGLVARASLGLFNLLDDLHAITEDLAENDVTAVEPPNERLLAIARQCENDEIRERQ